jgi:hypothetical protein
MATASLLDPNTTQRSGAAMAVANRESDEVRMLIMVAQQVPRDELAARGAVAAAFSAPKLAEQAQYAYAKGGTDISGPSIRAAEAVARAWGRIDHGWRVLSETTGPDGIVTSEVQAFAFDYQGLSRSSITFPVRHFRSTRQGGYKLTDDREVYELIANMAARRKRACILSLIPTDVVEEAMEQAEATLATRVDMSPEGIERMVKAFEQWGVTRPQIEKRIQRKVEAISKAHMVSLKRIWVSLRDGMSSVEQWFQNDAAATLKEALSDEPAATTTTPNSPAQEQASPPAQHAEPPPAALGEAELLTLLRKASNFAELATVSEMVQKLPDGPGRSMLLDEVAFRETKLENDAARERS